MQHGFLGNDSSFMLDFVVCALVLVVPILIYSIWLVKFKRNFALHRLIQILLGGILLVAVAAFEIDMRLHGGWENIVNKNPESPRLSAEQLSQVRQVLYIHLIFAVSTPFLWAITLFLATKRFPKPIQPGEHSGQHKLLGWLSTIDLTFTSITGLIFYYFAFMK